MTEPAFHDQRIAGSETGHRLRRVGGRLTGGGGAGRSGRGDLPAREAGGYHSHDRQQRNHPDSHGRLSSSFSRPAGGAEPPTWVDYVAHTSKRASRSPPTHRPT